MFSRFHYILIGLIVVIVYLFYLITYYKMSEFRTDTFITTMQSKNKEIEYRNKQKDFIEKYIQTLAYKTQVAKASQNKLLPGEVMVNVISEETVAGNREKDIPNVLSEIEKKQKEDPKAHLSNPERWIYLIKNGVTRD